MEKCRRKTDDVNKSDTETGISGVVNDKDKCVRLGQFCLMSSTSSGVTEANDKVLRFKLAIRMIGPMNDIVSKCDLSS